MNLTEHIFLNATAHFSTNEYMCVCVCVCVYLVFFFQMLFLLQPGSQPNLPEPNGSITQENSKYELLKMPLHCAVLLTTFYLYTNSSRSFAKGMMVNYVALSSNVLDLDHKVIYNRKKRGHMLFNIMIVMSIENISVPPVV